MQQLTAVNDLVVRFANVNGTGSASANNMFAMSIFRMGIPMTAKNIFPSNIQGLPTWYEVRVSEKGYLGRREGVDIMLCVNPQSMKQDVASVKPGGYFVYDNTKNLHKDFIRDDIHYIGIPMIGICMRLYSDARQRQLFKNMIYVGALAALLDIELDVVKGIIADEFVKKPKLIEPNVQAMMAGVTYIKENYDHPLGLRVERRDLVGDAIVIDGNTACGIGAVYAGATVAGWYPITPSTSLVEAFAKYSNRLRVDPATGLKKVAIVQAEDELAALGMVLGANWNGARAFTATSGPGLSLMNEFLGLAYFAEIPAVLVDVQRGGPSTGMPTRTQQSDLLLAAYASHGDTKHVLVIPSTPTECFEFMADAFDLAERLQTPVIVMTDLDLGMNDHLTAPLKWDDTRRYDRGKVYTAEDLDALSAMGKQFGRYLDVDGDGIPYRTLPATHPTKGSFFTRGTSHDEYARYTEDGVKNAQVLDRLSKKWDTAKEILPLPEFYQAQNESNIGMIFFGTTTYAALEAIDLLKEEEGITLDAMRATAFPFHASVEAFIEAHDQVFVVEQNRDAQFRTLLINELEINPKKLIKILNYDGMPITADAIRNGIAKHLEAIKL
ncbi:2-oxoacid:acceptor oxidoreductase subunit alpha [Runella slithyformis]|uniref:2-oxoacid:acceptor oxidoreductase, alpha subunit n=1 Tax=Runella slithyformis (strain ATCC 29530 / DSM 19594 / LMG 11500 / NCIMB 11436 / LSU 4) TaxID=761193 RepID=A0A7U4E8D5_RUNSL|nr:2-oxoacid:acceptor oxidoreductase subunit alpha [Runella slithyformis]AEI51223.1 2-oxoacid:acceptor oxidoreductase, alpha subunit [Runella slithyformis DSM 19594]